MTDFFCHVIPLFIVYLGYLPPDLSAGATRGAAETGVAAGATLGAAETEVAAGATLGAAEAGANVKGADQSAPSTTKIFAPGHRLKDPPAPRIDASTEPAGLTTAPQVSITAPAIEPGVTVAGIFNCAAAEKLVAERIAAAAPDCANERLSDIALLPVGN